MTPNPMTHKLPCTVLERGWLSSNSVLLVGGPGEEAVLIDSGHLVHAAQTVALVERVLANDPQGPRLLGQLVNTHLHSDHCGGNAALQARWSPRTLIPPGQAEAARRWDAHALSYEPTGQRCARFQVDGTLSPGETLTVGGLAWTALAAPGHDPHAIVLFEPHSATLLSADALWENGFGVVFPELEGVAAFDAVEATLDLIQGLGARSVVPGHGPVFHDVAAALERARRRLDGYRSEPRRHARYAAKVLLKYHLMEEGRQSAADLWDWCRTTPLLLQIWLRHMDGQVHVAQAGGVDPTGPAPAACLDWCRTLVEELLSQGALRRDGDALVDA